VPELHGRHFPPLLYVPLVQLKVHSLVQTKGPAVGRLLQASHGGVVIWSVHWPAVWPRGHVGGLHGKHLLVLLL
jgi:hypothetical protein